MPEKTDAEKWEAWIAIEQARGDRLQAQLERVAGNVRHFRFLAQHAAHPEVRKTYQTVVDRLADVVRTE